MHLFGGAFFCPETLQKLTETLQNQNTVWKIRCKNDRFCAFLHEKNTKIHVLKLGNNPMVGATVKCAVAVEEASK